MLSWNSWYNPLDNVASGYKSIAGGLGAIGTGSQSMATQADSDLRSAYNAPTSSSTGTSGGYAGATYYDTNTGQMMEWTGSGYRPVSASGASGGTEDLYGNASTLGATTGSGGSGSGSGSSGPSYDTRQLQALDSLRAQFERLLSGLDTTKQQGFNKIEDSYNLNRGRADQDRSKQLDRLGRQKTETEEGRVKALNQVGDNSRILRNSLMQRLGLASGGGSAFQLADNAVAREATKNRTGVIEDYSQNFRSLKDADTDARDTFARLMEDLSRQRNDARERVESGILGERQSINDRLQALAADRARLLGGDQLAAVQPYQNTFNSLQDRIQGLPDQYRQAVSYSKPTFQDVSLRDYVVDRANIGGSAPGRQTQYSPYQNFLNREREEEQELRG